MRKISYKILLSLLISLSVLSCFPGILNDEYLTLAETKAYTVSDGYVFTEYYSTGFKGQEKDGLIDVKKPQVYPDNEITRELNNKLIPNTKGYYDNNLNKSMQNNEYIAESYEYSFYDSVVSLCLEQRVGFVYSEYYLFYDIYHYDLSSSKFLNNQELIEKMGIDEEYILGLLNEYIEEEESTSVITSAKDVNSLKIFIDGKDIFCEIEYIEETNENIAYFLADLGDVREETPTPSPTEDSNTAKSKKLIIGSDNNRFEHTEVSNYSLRRTLLLMLMRGQSDGVKEAILKATDSEWGGSCFGMASTQGLVKLGSIRPGIIQEKAGCYYDFKMSDRTRDMVNYYHLSQYLPEIRENRTTVYRPGFLSNKYSHITLSNILQTIKLDAQRIKYGYEPFLLFIGWTRNIYKRVGHAVIVNDYEAMSNGEHRLEIVDSNKPEGYTYIYIDKDFSSWRYEGLDYSGLSESRWNYIAYSQFDIFDEIPSIHNETECINDTYLKNNKTNSIYLVVSGNDNFKIRNSNEEVFELSGDEIAGDFLPKSVDFLIGNDSYDPFDSDMILELDEMDSISIIPENNFIDISIYNDDNYVCVSSEGSDLLEVDLGKEISIAGSDVSYEIYASVGSDDTGLFKINDEETGNIKLKYTEDGIIFSADYLENFVIEQLSIDNKQIKEFSTDKNQVLISDYEGNDEDDFVLYISENDDNNYNIQLEEKKSVNKTMSTRSAAYQRDNVIVYVFISIVLFIIVIALIILVVKIYNCRPKILSCLSITGLSGIYAGRVFIISSDTVFGRDPHFCNIIFPAEHPGVSKRHCMLFYKKNKLFIKDLGSKYGTYISNGKLVSTKVSTVLNVGDEFYLGDDKCRFKVEKYKMN